MKPIQGGAGRYGSFGPATAGWLIRPLFFQSDGRTFKIVAVAPESKDDGPGFAAAIKRAKERAKRDYDVEI